MILTNPRLLLVIAAIIGMTSGHVLGALVAVAEGMGVEDPSARSLAEVCVLLGARFSVATPADYAPSSSEVARINALGSGEFVAGTDPVAAVAEITVSASPSAAIAARVYMSATRTASASRS